jgi:hypothetical protein
MWPAYLVEDDSVRGGREAQQRRAALCPSSQLGMGDMAAYLVEVDSARGGREAQPCVRVSSPGSKLGMGDMACLPG